MTRITIPVSPFLHTERATQFYLTMDGEGYVVLESAKLAGRYLMISNGTLKVDVLNDETFEDGRFQTVQLSRYHTSLTLKAASDECYVAFNKKGKALDPCSADHEPGKDTTTRLVFLPLQ